MKIIPIDQLYNYNYSMNVLNGLKQYWRGQDWFSCIHAPKERNMLLYLDGCKAEYTLKNGEKLYAGSGDMVYNPIGCEYRVRFYDFETETSNTVGVNFFLYDEEGEPFVLSDEILRFCPEDRVNYKLLFSKINQYSEAAVVCYSKMKAGMYEILSNLSMVHKTRSLKNYHLIAKGILHMEEYADEELSIAEIAALCNVSEGYFRRLFKEYSGLSPMEYRLRSKIEKAKTYLEYDIMTVKEIAQQLGFVDAAYFSKQFKAKTGMQPLAYKKQKTKKQEG